jgi:hypothetical protein
VCTYAASLNPHDYWPNALYDAREGNYRPVSTSADMNLGGVMSYVALDVSNLRRWLAGEIGSTGAQARSNNGYVVYFSDRRGDHNENLTGDPETAEYGAEDFVNPASSTGAPNTTLQTGEDVNANGSLDRYGESPHSLAIPSGAPASGTWSSAGRPWSVVANEPEARLNRQLLFRRALKLVNGGVSGGVTRLPAGGLTVASENPVYVQGNYNASNDPNVAGDPHVPASVVADAVTVLSNKWSDAQSLKTPNNAALRVAQTTGYRFAVVTGKGLSFPYPSAGSPQFLFGTDGGAGNFLRLLEDWRDVDYNYRGSMVSLFISRQAIGTFKYHINVYDYADRRFKFDEDFLVPALLPPATPMFRDVNTLKFRQILRPNQ